MKQFSRTTRSWIYRVRSSLSEHYQVQTCGGHLVFDPSQDTLVEILHTILLGHTKYVWYELHHNWTPAQQETFTVRLQSTNLDGLRVPPIRAAYMMQYRNGLIGKHFKTLMQTMLFHVQDIVTPDQFTLVRALGQLGPVLWIPVIDDMKTYLVCTVSSSHESIV